MLTKFTRNPLHFLKKTIYTPILILSLSNVTNAQTNKATQLLKDERVEKVFLNTDLQTPSVIKIAESKTISINNAALTLKELLKTGNEVDFKRTTATTNKNAVTIEKYQQYFKNIKVQHGVFNAITNGNKIDAFTGEYYDVTNLNITPAINEAQALEFALRFAACKKYAWEQAKDARDNETNPLRKQLYNAAYEKLLPKAELVIVKDFSTKNVVDISYKFDIYSGEPMARAYIYVNAHTGKIMLVDKIIKHVSPNQKDIKYAGLVPEIAFIMSGAADAAEAAPLAVGDTATVGIQTRFAGVRLMGTQNVSGSANDPSGNGALIVNSTNGLPFFPGQNPWILNDKRFHGVGSSQSEQTYDLNGIGGLPVSVPAYGIAKSFTDLDNNWTTAEHVRGGNNEAENDDFGFDAHWGAGIVYQYWKNIHGRLSYDNANSSIKSYIHSGIAYDNAFWNGSVMTYGDGSYQNGAQAGFAPLTSLDVCGHEIGHGVCTFTSDLVYQGESGAMNEGYSDIWAAMVENYAIQNIDPTLTASATNLNGFSIWDIGEQIDANDISGGTAPNLTNYPTFNINHTALRYMDFPHRAGNPASYAERIAGDGTASNWSDPNCTPPSLANDQCGVHNNSGVLNRMMYVLVQGSNGPGLTNTVNATNLAAHGSQSVTDGEPYNVTGIGFLKAEKIMYLAEQMLTPNAKFLEERNAAVLAAEILYGKCSFEWKQTILAFHSVAIGRSSDTALCSTLPVFSTVISRSSVSEATPKSADNCIDAVNNIELAYSILSPGIANPVTITVTPTGTAAINKDYTISQTVTTYSANETGLKKSFITIYNDAEIEGATPETIQLAIHAQDGFGFVKDTVITVAIADDDIAPVIGAGRTNLLVQNFDGVAGNSLPSGWSMIDKLGASTISWITGTTANAFGFATKAAFVKLNLIPSALATPAYDANAGGEVILKTPLIDATGKSDIKVKFTFAAGGEPSGDGLSTLDFGTLVYSLDGTNFIPFQFGTRQYSLTATATADSVMLPATLNNKQFYLGFNWYNDANVAVLPSFIIDDVVVTGGTQQIEKTLGEGVSEKQFDNKDIYYSSAQDGQIIARVFNNTADLGCVTAKVTEAGDGAATNIMFNGFAYQRAKRVVQITPSAPSTTTTYNVTLYVTVAELAGFTPSALHILKVKDGTPTTGTISPANAVELTPVFGNFSADGYYTYTLNNVTGFSQFVYAVNSSVLPQKLLSFNAIAQNNKFIKVMWASVNEGLGSHIVERAEKGSLDFKAINEQVMIGGAAINNYTFNDENVKANVVYQYRLKSVETTGTTYSNIKLASINSKINNVDIAPNPSKGMFKISINNFNGQAEMMVHNTAGQELIKTRKTANSNAPVVVDLTNKPAGVYTLKIKMDDRIEVYKLIVQ